MRYQILKAPSTFCQNRKACEMDLRFSAPYDACISFGTGQEDGRFASDSPTYGFFYRVGQNMHDYIWFQ